MSPCPKASNVEEDRHKKRLEFDCLTPEGMPAENYSKTSSHMI